MIVCYGSPSWLRWLVMGVGLEGCSRLFTPIPSPLFCPLLTCERMLRRWIPAHTPCNTWVSALDTYSLLLPTLHNLRGVGMVTFLPSKPLWHWQFKQLSIVFSAAHLFKLYLSWNCIDFHAMILSSAGFDFDCVLILCSLLPRWLALLMQTFCDSCFVNFYLQAPFILFWYPTLSVLEM